MLVTGQDGGECCGKAIGEVDPSTLGKTTSSKYTVVVVVVVFSFIKTCHLVRPIVKQSCFLMSKLVTK